MALLGWESAHSKLFSGTDFVKDIDELEPPEDDSWWGGDFEHIDFDSLFDEALSGAIKEMNNPEKEVLPSVGGPPQVWHEEDEPKIEFHGERFAEYFREG
jgi:hypothetical protein